MESIHNKEVMLPFIGNRLYMHGTTLFDFLLKFAPVFENLTFKVMRVIESDRIRINICPDGGSEKKYFAIMEFNSGNNSSMLCVEPLSPSKKQVRLPDETKGILASTEYSDGGIHCKGGTSYSFITNAVFMNKALIQKTYNVKKNEEFLFVRTDLKRVPDSRDSFNLKLNHVTRKNMYLTQILSGKEVIGDIYFLKT